MGLLDSIKQRVAKSEKTEVDYGLEKLIKKAEQVPIHFNKHDFRGGNFTDVAETVKRIFADKEDLKKSDEKNRISGNNFIARDKTWEIEYLFGPVMETMKEDQANEKDPQRAEKIAEEYRKTEKIVNDLKTRVQLWAEVGEKMAESEYHGTFIDEEFKNNVQKLVYLEEKYREYNDGRGLEALEKAMAKIEQGDRDLSSAKSGSDKERKSIHEHWDAAKRENPEKSEERNGAEEKEIKEPVSGRGDR